MVILVVVISAFLARFILKYMSDSQFQNWLIYLVLLIIGLVGILASPITFKLDLVDLTILVLGLTSLLVLMLYRSDDHRIRQLFYVSLLLILLLYLVPKENRLLIGLVCKSSTIHNTDYNLKSYSFISGFTDQGCYISINKNIGIFERYAASADGYIHDFSENLTDFKIEKDSGYVLLFYDNLTYTNNRKIKLKR